MTATKEERSTKKQLQLKTENSLLGDQLDREREEQKRLVNLLEDAVSARPTVKKRRFGIIRTLVIIGIAYVVGARAGRGRYEEILTWARRNIVEKFPTSARPAPE